MSSFFLKGKPRNVPTKRKYDNTKKKDKAKKPAPNLEKKQDDESSESELEDLKKFSDVEDSDNEHETAEQKKLRLAKQYLEEISKEEEKRAELKETDELVSKRLKEDYLEQKGKLQFRVADKYDETSISDVQSVRCKEHKLTVTCICVTSDGNYLFSGSKCSSIVKWSLKEKKKVCSKTFKSNNNLHKSSISALAVTTDSMYLASADQSNKDIQIWDAATLNHLRTFKGHKDIVTGLVFRKNTHQLYSASKDRGVKTWSLDEMCYVETLFGHQAAITAIDALTRERAITAGGRDNSIRVWKIVEESQLVYNGPSGSLDEVKLINEDHFVTGGDDGSICLWGVMKKKPTYMVAEAHGSINGVPRWITSLAAVLNGDVVASGSHDGSIKIWKIGEGYRKLTLLFNIDVKGFVNGMQFSATGETLYAAVGQEHKLARWWREKDAKNNVTIINLKLNETKT